MGQAAPERTRATSLGREVTTVAVVIATRNRIDHLRDAVASVERQTFDRWEVVIVDDESSDDTTRWACAHPDSRVRCVRLDRNVERSAARNFGVGETRASYTLFLDDDDRLRPMALERLVAALDENASAVAAVGAYALADDDGNRRRGFHPRRRIQRRLWRDALFEWNAPQGRTLYRTDVFRAAGGFPEHLSFAEDRDLWLRVTRLGPAVSIPDVVVDYRVQHAGRSDYSDGLAAVERVVAAHVASLDADERPAAERVADVRRAWLEGSRALTELRGRHAAKRFLSAIRSDPSVLRSPFVRPQLLRPLGKSLLCVVIGRRGMLLVRRAAASTRRRLHRAVGSSDRVDERRPDPPSRPDGHER